MNFALVSQLLLDEDADVADDFDLDFDEDFEYLSDEEFEVFIDEEEYDADDFDVSGNEFCLDDDLDGFGDFDSSEDSLPEKDYVDED